MKATLKVPGRNLEPTHGTHFIKATVKVPRRNMEPTRWTRLICLTSLTGLIISKSKDEAVPRLYMR